MKRTKNKFNTGTTAYTNLEWLLRFLTLDVDELTLEELGSVLREIQAIARLAISNNSGRFPKWELVPAGKVQPDGHGLAYREWVVREDLAHYQRVLRRAIREMVTTGRTTLHVSTSLTVPSVAFEITRPSRDRQPTLILTKPSIDDVYRAFDLRLLFVLQAHADAITTCPRGACAKIFIKTRTNQDYCSKYCGTFDRVQKWRIKKRADQKKHARAKKGGKGHEKR